MSVFFCSAIIHAYPALSIEIVLLWRRHSFFHESFSWHVITFDYSLPTQLCSQSATINESANINGRSSRKISRSLTLANHEPCQLEQSITGSRRLIKAIYWALNGAFFFVITSVQDWNRCGHEQKLFWLARTLFPFWAIKLAFIRLSGKINSRALSTRWMQE